jgi:chromosome segregation ATPase
LNTKNLKTAAVPAISPSQGVPPPNDHKTGRKSDDSPDESESFTDFEVLEMKSTTENLYNQLKTKIIELKEVNDEHLDKKTKVLEESEMCQEELELMKESLGEMITETYKTKEELKEMREIIEGGSSSEYSESFVASNDQVGDQLKDLKNAIDYMNYRLSNTEDELKNKQIENDRLKNTVSRLRESISLQKAEMEKKGNPICEICRIV